MLLACEKAAAGTWPFGTVQHGHNDISDQEMNAPLLYRQLHGIPRLVCSQHGISLFFKILSNSIN